MTRFRRAAALTAIACAVLACASTRAEKPSQTGPPPPAPTRIEVENANWMDVTVFAVRGGSVVRLGLVTAKSTAAFDLPEVLQRSAEDLRFLVDPVGSGEAYLSDPIRVSPGDLIQLKVGARLEQSTVSVW